ncbi:MAG: exonuclease domain-containing protein [Cyclobacteriaceae bacterium]|nr:exonuclease domain-containing protein [Cyclobacteriaceae bacterium]
MYAIVDIETTGGYAQSNRITEVAVFIHDGVKITDSFESLINPQQAIPPYITGLTGISDETIQGAPSFAEVAEELSHMLSGNVFVAHNVHFDYSFLKMEFSALGIDLNLKKLCTVRLSRKLLPGLNSYSLGNVAESLGIQIENRHRAAGDAEATVKLFDYLYNLNPQVIIDSLKRASGETNLPPNLNSEEVDALPDQPGVYYFHNKAGEVIYVGKAVDIRKRIISHFTGVGSTWSNTNIRSEIHHVSFELTGNELIALLLEVEEIKRLWPKYNSAGKTFKIKWGLYGYTDGKGYLRLQISKSKQGIRPLKAFGTHAEAWQFLINKITAFTLCPKLCGIQQSKGACFDFKGGICKGACAERERPEDYNERANQAMKSFSSEESSYIIPLAGRVEEEKSIVLVENGKFIGFGFVPFEMQFLNIDQVRDFIKPRKDHQEIYQIVDGFVNSGRVEIIRFE